MAQSIAAGDATGPGVLCSERGGASGQELEVDQLPVLHEVRDGRRLYRVQAHRSQHPGTTRVGTRQEHGANGSVDGR